MHRPLPAERRLARPTAGRLALYAGLAALFVYVAVLFVDGVGLEARAVRLRVWSLLAAGVFAVAVPHVLLPDPAWTLLQLLNRSPRGLLGHQLRRWSRVVALFAGPCLILAYVDPGGWSEALGAKTLALLPALATVLGAGLYGFLAYVTIGQTSQAWQEGRAGGTYRTMNRQLTAPVALPPGMIPALLATARVFLVGVLFVAAGAYAARFFGPAVGWVPGVVLLGWVGLRLRRETPVYDRHFYSTNAFYAEIFRSAGGIRAVDQEPIPYAAVYWTPRRWRPHVWAGLRQLDRKLAMGRLVLLGHAAFWVLLYDDAPAEIVTAYLLLFAAAKNAGVYLLTTQPFAPEPFQVTLQSPAGWAATRFFVNLRWTLPWILSLAVAATFDDALGFAEAAYWTGVDLLLAVVCAVAFTFVNESRYRRRYA